MQVQEGVFCAYYMCIKRKDCPRKQKGLFCLYDLMIKNYRPVQANIMPGGRIVASLHPDFFCNMEEERKSIKWLTLP